MPREFANIWSHRNPIFLKYFLHGISFHRAFVSERTKNRIIFLKATMQRRGSVRFFYDTFFSYVISNKAQGRGVVIAVTFYARYLKRGACKCNHIWCDIFLITRTPLSTCIMQKRNIGKSPPGKHAKHTEESFQVSWCKNILFEGGLLVYKYSWQPHVWVACVA